MFGLGSRRDEEARVQAGGRLPPGQSLTQKFPVLHYGPVPRFKAATWDFHVWGEVEARAALDLGRIQPAAAHQLHMDIHCVTRWSKFDTEWEGVSLQTLIDAGSAQAASRPRSYVMQHAEYGFTVNLPLEVVLAGNFLLATHFDGAAASPPITDTPCEAWWAPSPGGTSSHVRTSGRAPSGCAGWNSWRRIGPASGSRPATITRRMSGKNSARPAGDDTEVLTAPASSGRRAVDG